MDWETELKKFETFLWRKTHHFGNLSESATAAHVVSVSTWSDWQAHNSEKENVIKLKTFLCTICDGSEMNINFEIKLKEWDR